MIWEIISLALVDAINPCTIAVQLLLLSTALKKGRNVLTYGLAFSFTVAACYGLYGLGLLSFLYLSGMDSWLRLGMEVLLGLMIMLELNGFITGKEGMQSMEMPMFLRPYARRLTSSISSLWSAVVIAALCSLILLPCSSGPYLVALSMLKSSAYHWLYMALYLMIFILPMIGLTFMVWLGMMPEKVMEWRKKHIRYMHLASALLLSLVLYLLI